MYKHWEAQKKRLVELIAAGQSAVCQVCYGTNYSIFFRNLHADLLLKRSIVPIYIDLNHLAVSTIESFYSLAISSFKRSLTEKKLNPKAEEESTTFDLKTTFEKMVAEISSKGLTTVLFFEDIEKSKALIDQIFIISENLKLKNAKFSVVYLSKTNFLHPTVKPKYDGLTHLYENILYFPLRDEKTLKATETGTSPQLLSVIYSLTGGVDKFYSVAVDLKNNLPNKERKNIKKHISSNWHLKEELNRLWDTFSTSETKAITNVVLKSESVKNELVHDIEHLVNLGVLTRKGKGYELTVGLLKETGYERASKDETTISFKGDKIIVNGNKISIKLSDVEKKILKQFLSNKNKIVGRKLIAKSIWNNEMRYNDIIVDETVTKLKTKLTEAWVNPNKFVSIEGRGFIYRETE